MSFDFTVVNISPVAKFWAATFYIDNKEYWLGIAEQPGKFVTYPVAGIVSHVVIGLYDSSYRYLGGEYTKDIYYGLSVADGEKYRFDWSTNQFEPVSLEPMFSNLEARISNQYPKLGENIVTWVHFDYTGGDRIGTTQVKIAIGHDRIAYFDEVQPMVWIKLINLYESKDSYQVQFPITIPETVGKGIYDFRIEIGTYPWSSKVYAKKLYNRAFSISAEPPPGVPPPKPPPDGGPLTELGKWAPWLIVGGAALFLVALMRR